MHTDSDKQTRLPEAETTVASVGARLQEARTRRGWSVHDLAGQADVSAGMISQIERGLANPSFNVLSKISSALGLQLGVFFEERPGLAREFQGADPIVGGEGEIRKDQIHVLAEKGLFEVLPGLSAADSALQPAGLEQGLD